MYCTNTFLKKCPYCGAGVEIIVSVEAESGAGCTIDWDRMEETCERQSECPHFQKELCLIASEE